MFKPYECVTSTLNRIIYNPLEKHQYIFDKSQCIKDLTAHNNHIAIPLVVDTEYTGNQRTGITVQVNGIHQDSTGLIYDHKDLQEYATIRGLKLRHTPITHNFAPLNYLESSGHDVELLTYNYVIKTDIEGNKLPYCQFDIYAHFALAELFMIFTGEARERVKELVLSNHSRVIDMTRRLRTYTVSKKGYEVNDSIELPLHIKLDGREYRVKLRIIDSCALHGVASYKNLASATGVKLKYKETLTVGDLENMIDTYFNKSEDFDNYALGDLAVYQILANNSELFKKVYKSLEIENYFKHPKLTIGSTVRDLFKGVLYKNCGIKPDEKEKQDRLIEFLSFGSSSTLKHETTTTKCLLAKVFGGRCRNNRPTDITNENREARFTLAPNNYKNFSSTDLKKNIFNFVVDNDIAGAYGNGLRNQIYPIGRPVIEKFERSKYNQYNTLRQWLKRRKYGKPDCELVDGLWTAIVSTKEIDADKYQYKILKHPQDFLISWFGFRFSEVEKMKTDTDTVDLEILPKTGDVKILNHQVVQAVITSEFLEWLFNICNPSQRNELLDNLYINTACYYPSYSRVDTYDELLDRFDEWQLKNTTNSRKTKVKKGKKEVFNGSVHMVNNEPTAWIGLDLGKLIVDDLLAWRAMHKKLDGKKSPMDVLFKLCTNTLYGIFCSPYFDISNTVVGNNITARCRAMAWYMEKGHYAYQTITDGGQINPNTLCYPSTPKRKITALSVTNLYRESNPTKRNLRLKPLANCDRIEPYSENDTTKVKLYKDNEITVIDDSKEWLQIELFKHLQNIFPNVSVLHQETTKLDIEISEDRTPIKKYSPQKGMFSFEIKDIYTKARFHGTSNYLLANERETKIAMRSYENKRKHQAFIINEDDEIIKTEFYNNLPPSQFLLEQLDNPNRVERSKVFKKTGILKLNDWKNNFSKWLEKGYLGGDTIEKIGLLREFSISQFTYQTIEQYQAIVREVERNKRRYNQSYEGYFLNDDGTLDYELMIKTIDSIIASGSLSINKELDKDRHRIRDIDISHPENKVYEIAKQQANKRANLDNTIVEKDNETTTNDDIWSQIIDDLDMDLYHEYE